MWDSSVLERVNHHMGEFSVSILVRNKEDEGLWASSGVYGSCDVGGV